MPGLWGIARGRHKGTDCSGGRGTNLPFPKGRKPAGKVAIVIWIWGGVRKEALLHHQCWQVRVGGAETRHLRDQGLPGGTEGARHPRPGSGTSYRLNHPKTILKPPTNTNNGVKRWTHVAGASLPELQVEAGIEKSSCSPRILFSFQQKPFAALKPMSSHQGLSSAVRTAKVVGTKLLSA